MSIEVPLVISPHHPALAGHFPGVPIIPGVVLLDEVLRAIEVAHNSTILRCTIPWVKFYSSVGAAESLTLQYERRPDCSIGFVIRAPDRVVADGVATPSFSDTAVHDVS